MVFVPRKRHLLIPAVFIAASLVLAGCSTAKPVDNTPTPVSTPTSLVLQEVNVDLSGIAGSEAAAESFSGSTTWSDDQGYSYSADFTPSVSFTRDVADSRPGEIEFNAVFTADGTVRNTTPSRDSPKPIIVLYPFWASSSAVCTLDGFAAEASRDTFGNVCVYGGISLGDLDVKEIAAGGSLPVSGRSDGIGPEFTAAETSANAFESALKAPDGWLASSSTVGNGANCGGYATDLIWSSSDIGCTGVPTGVVDDDEQVSGGGGDITGAVVSAATAKGSAAAIERLAAEDANLTVCPLGPGFNSPLVDDYPYVICSFDKGIVTVRVREQSDTTKVRDWVVANAARDSESYISQQIRYADGTMFVVCYPDVPSCSLTWMDGGLIVEYAQTVEEGEVQLWMSETIADFAGQLVPMLNSLATA